VRVHCSARLNTRLNRFLGQTQLFASALLFASACQVLFCGASVAASVSQTESDYELRFVYPARTVYSLAFDAAGFLWVGTDADLLRTDGTFFTSHRAGSPFPLENPRVFRLAGTKDGALWAGLGGGLLRFSGSAWTMDEIGDVFGLHRLGDEKWTSPEVPSTAGRGAMIWSLMAGEDGSLWYGEGGCVRRFLKTALTSYCVPEGFSGAFVLSMTPDADGRPLLGGLHGVLRFDGEKLVPHALKEPVHTLLREPNGRVWAGTGTGLVAIDGQAETRRFTTADGLGSNVVNAIAGAANGGLWIGTSAGLFLLRNDKIQSTGLSNAAVLALQEDPAGSVWIGTRTLGLARLTRRAVQNLGVEGDVGGAARAILRDGEAMLYTSAAGLNRNTVQTAEVLQPPGSWGAISLCGMARSATGAIFIGTDCGPSTANAIGLTPASPAGLVIFRGGQWHRLTTDNGLPRNDPTMVMIDRAGDLWLGWAGGGLSRIKGGSDLVDTVASEAITNFAADTLCRMPIGAGLQDANGDHWFSAEWDPYSKISTGGVVRIRGQGPPVCYTEQDGLPNRIPTSIAEDGSGTLWVGSRSDGGLSRFVPGKDSGRGHFENFRTTDGLACDTIHEVVPDGAQLWATCRGGVARTALEEFKKGGPLPIHSIGIGAAEGMRQQETTRGVHPSAAVAPDGRLWVATPAGVAIIEGPPARPPNLVLKPPVINTVALNGQSRSPGGGIELRADRAELELTIALPSFVGQHRMPMIYRLDGRDTKWQRSTVPIRALSFSGLTPGAYRLRVRASDGYGGWSDVESTLAVQLRPLLYKTLSFQLSCVFFFFAALFGFARWRAHRLVQRHAAIQEERARIARDLHDEIGQSYASIGLHLDALELALHAAPPPTLDLFARFRKVLDQARTDTRRSIWRLRSEVLEQPPLDESLRVIVKQQREALDRGGPQLTLRVSGGPFKPMPQVDHELTQIAREAINNAVKHANAKNIVVDIVQSGVGIRLKVTDDGSGMNEPTPELIEQGHFGLIGMQERAIRSGARVQVHSAPGAGTEVIVTIPVPSANE
jgi:signal transduction histidine kinase/ligand-binding sensor domain-containing protein